MLGWVEPITDCTRCLNLPRSLASLCGPQRGQFVRLFEPAWALLEDGLAVTLRDSLLRG